LDRWGPSKETYSFISSFLTQSVEQITLLHRAAVWRKLRTIDSNFPRNDPDPDPTGAGGLRRRRNARLRNWQSECCSHQGRRRVPRGGRLVTPRRLPPLRRSPV